MIILTAINYILTIAMFVVAQVMSLQNNPQAEVACMSAVFLALLLIYNKMGDKE